MKKIIIVLALSMFAATAAFADTGKVVSVADGKAVVDMGADNKLKKGSGIKIDGKNGKVLAVEGNNLTLKVRGGTAHLKAGDTVDVKKAAIMQGC